MAINYKLVTATSDASSPDTVFTATAVATHVKSVRIANESGGALTYHLAVYDNSASIEVPITVPATSLPDDDVDTMVEPFNLQNGDYIKLYSSGAGVKVAITLAENTDTAGASSSDDLPEGVTNLYLTSAERTKLSGIATGAEVNQNAFSNVAVAGQTTVAADAKTDTLTLAAGTGITITTDDTTDTVTITNSATGANAFGNVAVAGQTTVAADGTNDTLTIAAGTGITLTTDATTDTLTITNSVTAPNSFETIAVAGQTSVVADGSTDTLTLAAGTGITITTDASTDTVTITNSATGANAFGNVAVAGQTTVAADSTNDTLTIAAGTGITLTTDATTDTLTITNSVTAPNTFGTIAVAGQSNVVADSTTDTLTLVAGTNITLTTDATTDSITIAASGGTPAGSTGQIQYNSAGAFGAEAALYYDATNNRLSVGGNTSPTGTITSRGAGTTTGTTFLCEDSGGAARFTVYDRGTMFTNERSDVAANVHSFVLNATKNEYWRPTIALKNTSFSAAIAGYIGDTNTLGYFGTAGGTADIGGLALLGACSNLTTMHALAFHGFHNSTAPTGPILRWTATKYAGSGSGSSMLAALADGETILTINNYGLSAGTLTRVAVLGSGAMGLRNTAPTSSTSLTVRGHGTGTGISLLVENSGGTARFTVRDDGAYAFAGGTVGAAQTGYTTFTNLTTDRTCDANATTVEELADILGTLIEDLKTKGIIAA